ncbi:MAG: hypothetical protein ACLFTI_10005 [Anaerolineales bacterium]
MHCGETSSSDCAGGPLVRAGLRYYAVTLGLGYLVTMDRPPFDLRGTPLLIVLGHTLVALPFVVRSVLPALQPIRPNCERPPPC